MIVTWIFINIHGDTEDHPANQQGVWFPYGQESNHTVAQPCSDRGLFSPRRDCIPQTSDKTWITEEKMGSSYCHSHGKLWLSLPQKGLWILEADLLYWVVSSTWGQLNLCSGCDFLPAKRKPILSSFSLLLAFTLSANVSCESLLSLKKFQITPFIFRVFLKPRISLGTPGP